MPPHCPCVLGMRQSRCFPAASLEGPREPSPSTASPSLSWIFKEPELRSREKCLRGRDGGRSLEWPRIQSVAGAVWPYIAWIQPPSTPTSTSHSALIPWGSSGNAAALTYFSSRANRFLTGGWGSLQRILCQREKERHRKVINGINEGTWTHEKRKCSAINWSSLQKIKWAELQLA